MLQRTFKSAKELGLSDLDHQTLITTLGMLERGECTPFRYEDGDYCIWGHAKCVNPDALSSADWMRLPKALTSGVFGMWAFRDLKHLNVDDAIRIL